MRLGGCCGAPCGMHRLVLPCIVAAAVALRLPALPVPPAAVPPAATVTSAGAVPLQGVARQGLECCRLLMVLAVVGLVVARLLLASIGAGRTCGNNTTNCHAILGHDCLSRRWQLLLQLRAVGLVLAQLLPPEVPVDVAEARDCQQAECVRMYITSLTHLPAFIGASTFASQRAAPSCEGEHRDASAKAARGQGKENVAPPAVKDWLEAATAVPAGPGRRLLALAARCIDAPCNHDGKQSASMCVYWLLRSRPANCTLPRPSINC